jgi:hypothetical protein
MASVGRPLLLKSENQSSEAVINPAVGIIRVGTKSKSPSPRKFRGSIDASPVSNRYFGLAVQFFAAACRKSRIACGLRSPKLNSS